MGSEKRRGFVGTVDGSGCGCDSVGSDVIFWGSMRVGLAVGCVVAIGACASCMQAGSKGTADLASSAGGADLVAPSGGGDLAASSGEADLAGAPLPDLTSTTAMVPMVTLSFTEQPGDVLNPERGWIDWIDLVNDRDFSSTRTAGKTLSYAKIILPANVDTLPSTLLDDLDAGLTAVRAAGTKVFLRAYYIDGAQTADPATSRIVSHIGQLQPLLADHADVIAFVQAGFLGPWGEFHSTAATSNGEWTQVIDALFSALPSTRMMQFRTPSYKNTYFGGMIADAQAFTGVAVARAGHYNDCFLASPSDVGTYPDPIATWKAFVASDTRYTPMGGETCDPGSAVNRFDCPSALAELAALHWSFLNDAWWGPVVAPSTGSWAVDGCRAEITERLGYRFLLESATVSAGVRPGDTLELAVTLRNDGFATPFNPRSLFVVLQRGGTTYTAKLVGDDVDPRRWSAGASHAFVRRLAVPLDAAPGSYTLALWLPDAAPSLAARPEYAIRFVNQGTWSAANGYNLLTTSLPIDDNAVPNSTPADGAFAQ